MFININIHWLSVIKYQMTKKRNQQKRNDLKINNIIQKRIREYSKVTHHRKNDCERRMVYNSSRIIGRKNNISKSY